MKKLLLLIVSAFLFLTSCNWFHETPETGKLLAKHFNNKLYNKFDTAEYNLVFRKHLDSLSKQLSNPKTFSSFYASKDFTPQLLTRFFANGELDTLSEYIGRSREDHGFNPELFGFHLLNERLEALAGNKFKSIEEAYPVIADLELQAAESLVKYHNLVYYGSQNPRKLFNRYYIPMKRPDSAGMVKVLETKDLQQLLKDIQPASPSYSAFQKVLKKYQNDTAGNSYRIKTLLVNMERLRWKMPDKGDEYVEVNIPDFSLTWFRKQDTLKHMKVCVGARRKDDYKEKIALFLKTENLDDKPKNHETPIMFSRFTSIQVNPIWNIPVSIAKSEIYWLALKDPYYLSNNNIKVYLKGQIINDPDTIQWSKYPRERLPFQFKQGSGNNNALGKFKFIFENGSSIYLHDTNNKAAFSRANRAISHGCVRVEQPLDFAELLVKDKYQFDDLRMEVNLPPLDTNRMAIFQKKLAKKADTVTRFQLKPKWFGVKKPIPIILNYYTAWAQNGSIQFRPDVYRLDETLWIAMRKFL